MNVKPTRQQPTAQSQPSSSSQPSRPTPTGQPASAQPPGARPTAQHTATGSQRRSGPPADRPTEQADRPQRLVSLDAYRGFIMIMLTATGFGIHQLTQLPADAPVWQDWRCSIGQDYYIPCGLDYDIWQQIGAHFEHPAWKSQFGWIGVYFWDLIQPAFMFMVGVAMPYSFARRETLGHSGWRRSAHAAWRALVLVLLGVFLSSNWASQTNWTFVNVLSQIGLAYLFVYALLGRRFWLQLLAFVVILAGYWGFFYSYTPPTDYEYENVGVVVSASELESANEASAGAETAAQASAESAGIFSGRMASWSKNANAGHEFDVWLLNKFPRAEEFKYNKGGYVTLNFVPSIATLLLGVFCGQLLRSEARWWQKFLLLVLGGAACMGLGVLAGEYACPIVKRIWTPSWVLFSGGWVIWMLAAFYLVFDLCRLRWFAFPLVIVGMNSIVMYMIWQLARPWATRTVEIHFLGLLQRIEIQTGMPFLADNMYGRVWAPTSAFIIFWLMALWMYRQKFFAKI